MVTFPVPCDDAKKLQAELFDRHRIEIPAVVVGDRVCLRLSVQAYVTEDDCDQLVDALEVVLA
jgi:selenocysteine lyase/cysteine desulfurase